jgi:branched-chain amino acid transport system substrate-binding protein
MSGSGSIQRRRRRRGTVLALACILAGLAVAGCGDDDGGGEGGNAGAKRPEGKPYKIGYITDLSGPLRESYSPTLEGFQLYMKQLDAEGGIDGHPVDVAVRDDALNADKAVSAAVELGRQENVSGIFGLSLSSTHEPVYAAMRRAKVPVMTGFSGTASALPPAQPYAYSAGTIFEIAGQAAGEFTEQLADGGTFVCVTFESVGGIAACDANEALARDAGFEVERLVFPIATREFTSIGSEIADRDPSIVIGHYGSEQNVGVIAALRRAGYEGPYVAANYGVTEDALRQAMQAAGSQENIYTFGRYVSVDDEAEGLDELKAAADEFGTDFELSNAHVSGWAVARVAHEALAKCGFPCDAQQLDKALQGLTVESQGITGAPITFTAEDHYGDSFWRLYKFEVGEDAFVPEGDWIELPPKALESNGG